MNFRGKAGMWPQLRGILNQFIVYLFFFFLFFLKLDVVLVKWVQLKEVNREQSDNCLQISSLKFFEQNLL